MDDVEEMICRTQANIFSYMAERGYDMGIFANAYMTADWTKRAMDTTYSRFQIREPEECLDYLLPEIEHKLKKYEDDKMFATDVAEWIGYTYRQLYIETDVDSAVLCKKIPFSTMCKYYPGMHTINEDYTADIISKNAGILLKEEFTCDE